MIYFDRILDLSSDAQKKSVFLLGPRQTGKTAYLKKNFPNAPFYNLLLADTFLRVSQRPQIIREELLSQKGAINGPIIIDEIQKLPVLLDEVHAMIEEYDFHFILSGSSARKLRRGGANLLAGRARTRYLFPLTSKEIPGYDFPKMINHGSLPFVYLSDEPEEDLANYVGTYLKEEVQAEGLARRIDNFSRFLQTAALSDTEILNFTEIAADAQIPPRTIREYYSILEDTLIGTFLQPFTKTRKRKASSTAKFYFFDRGVSNLLAGRKGIKPKTELFGKALEHFIFTELKAYLSYTKNRSSLTFWRATQGPEVDFLVDDATAIEVKGTHLVSQKHIKGLKALSEDMTLKKKIVVSLDENPRNLDGIAIIPVKQFLEELWDGSVI
jgi:uncharacterized protein